MTIGVESAAHGLRIGWGAPTYDQVRIGWNEAKKAAGMVANFTQQRMVAEFPGGGYIFFRSLDDPDNARGHSADGWLFDESADIKAWAYYEIVYPMLIEDPLNFFWGAGTPKGRNWFWYEHVKAKDLEDSVSWTIPTVGCEIQNGKLVRIPHPLENPFIEFDEIEKMYQRSPEKTFRQEMLAEFIEHEGAVFRGLGEAVKTDKERRKQGKPAPRPQDHKGHSIFFGVDWGKENDFTVISGVCSNCKTQVLFDRFNQIDYAFQTERLKAHVDRWKPSLVNPERNSMGEPLVEQLYRDGIQIASGTDGKLGFNTTAVSKPPLIEDFSLALEKGELQIFDEPVQINELLAYERTTSKSGKPSYNAPEGVHDDTVMALALAWNAVVRGGITLA